MTEGASGLGDRAPVEEFERDHGAPLDGAEEDLAWKGVYARIETPPRLGALDDLPTLAEVRAAAETSTCGTDATSIMAFRPLKREFPGSHAGAGTGGRRYTDTLELMGSLRAALGAIPDFPVVEVRP